ncbi:hypothetical protein M3Y98_00853300 [Aphelenchoides besseyi]|nr:hypothetical protein M3Y98_00853300 [Aphelenchoides besseyi]KAI6211104.1 hypothetical protein M3Y96_00398000 [Aphelenchoides besseyi]
MTKCHNCNNNAEHYGMVVYCTPDQDIYNAKVVTCKGMQEVKVFERILPGHLLAYKQDKVMGFRPTEPTKVEAPTWKNLQVFDESIAVVTTYKFTLPSSCVDNARKGKCLKIPHDHIGNVLYTKPEQLIGKTDVTIAASYFESDDPRLVGCQAIALGYRCGDDTHFTKFPIHGIPIEKEDECNGIYDQFTRHVTFQRLRRARDILDLGDSDEPFGEGVEQANESTANQLRNQWSGSGSSPEFVEAPTAQPTLDEESTEEEDTFFVRNSQPRTGPSTSDNGRSIIDHDMIIPRAPQILNYIENQRRAQEPRASGRGGLNTRDSVQSSDLPPSPQMSRNDPKNVYRSAFRETSSNRENVVPVPRDSPSTQTTLRSTDVYTETSRPSTDNQRAAGRSACENVRSDTLRMSSNPVDQTSSERQTQKQWDDYYDYSSYSTENHPRSSDYSTERLNRQPFAWQDELLPPCYRNDPRVRAPQRAHFARTIDEEPLFRRTVPTLMRDRSDYEDSSRYDLSSSTRVSNQQDHRTNDHNYYSTERGRREDIHRASDSQRGRGGSAANRGGRANTNDFYRSTQERMYRAEDDWQEPGYGAYNDDQRYNTNRQSDRYNDNTRLRYRDNYDQEAYAARPYSYQERSYPTDNWDSYYNSTEQNNRNIWSRQSYVERDERKGYRTNNYQQPRSDYQDQPGSSNDRRYNNECESSQPINPSIKKAAEEIFKMLTKEQVCELFSHFMSSNSNNDNRLAIDYNADSSAPQSRPSAPSNQRPQVQFCREPQTRSEYPQPRVNMPINLHSDEEVCTPPPRNVRQNVRDTTTETVRFRNDVDRQPKNRNDEGSQLISDRGEPPKRNSVQPSREQILNDQPAPQTDRPKPTSDQEFSNESNTRVPKNNMTYRNWQNTDDEESSDEEETSAEVIQSEDMNINSTSANPTITPRRLQRSRSSDSSSSDDQVMFTKPKRPSGPTPRAASRPQPVVTQSPAASQFEHNPSTSDYGRGTASIDPLANYTPMDQAAINLINSNQEYPDTDEDLLG